MKLRYFKLSEFDSPDEPGSGAKHMDYGFLKMLDAARHHSGVPYRITSGYRTQAHHDHLTAQGYKTSSTSAHLQGFAADIYARSNHARMMVIYGLVKAGFNRIGVGRTFIHVDDHPDKRPDVMWLY